ncbi:MAG TPA: hypothetical protein VEJ16_18420, partial [Alphaproteobacteria bacterium]|nr:hypothetical protein [Alphaproteobacteria bacterium]
LGKEGIASHGSHPHKLTRGFVIARPQRLAYLKLVDDRPQLIRHTPAEKETVASSLKVRTGLCQIGALCTSFVYQYA